MSKEERPVEGKEAPKKEEQKNGNVQELVGARQAPNVIENEINKFFKGEKIVVDGVTKEAKPIGRKEVFFFGLSVPEKNIDAIYGKDAPSQKEYEAIPKFYRDNNGNLKNYDNGREIQEIAAKITEAVAAVGKNASNYYSLESQQKLRPLLYRATQDGTRVLSAESALGLIDAAITSAGEKNKDARYIEVNLDAGYQKILDNLNKTLETYKELAEIVKKEPTIAYASAVAITGRTEPMAEDYRKMLGNVIINQKAITGLDPSDTDFKTKLKAIDPATLDNKMELTFTTQGDKLLLNTQIKGKDFIKLIDNIDQKKLENLEVKLKEQGESHLWKREELAEARKMILEDLDKESRKSLGVRVPQDIKQARKTMGVLDAQDITLKSYKSYFSEIKSPEQEKVQEEKQAINIGKARGEAAKSNIEKKVDEASRYFSEKIEMNGEKLQVVSPERAFKILSSREQNKGTVSPQEVAIGKSRLSRTSEQNIPSVEDFEKFNKLMESLEAPASPRTPASQSPRATQKPAEVKSETGLADTEKLNSEAQNQSVKQKKEKTPEQIKAKAEKEMADVDAFLAEMDKNVDESAKLNKPLKDALQLEKETEKKQVEKPKESVIDKDALLSALGNLSEGKVVMKGPQIQPAELKGVEKSGPVKPDALSQEAVKTTIKTPQPIPQRISTPKNPEQMEQQPAAPVVQKDENKLTSGLSEITETRITNGRGKITIADHRDKKKNPETELSYKETLSFAREMNQEFDKSGNFREKTEREVATANIDKNPEQGAQKPVVSENPAKEEKKGIIEKALDRALGEGVYRDLKELVIRNTKLVAEGIAKIDIQAELKQTEQDIKKVEEKIKKHVGIQQKIKPDLAEIARKMGEGFEEKGLVSKNSSGRGNNTPHAEAEKNRTGRGG